MAQKENPYRDTRQFLLGEIWTIKDTEIFYPKFGHDTSKIPAKKLRSVVIVSNEIYGKNPDYPTVLVAPINTRTDLANDQDIILRAADTPLREDSAIELSIVQPTLKINLLRRVGRFDDETITKIRSVLLCNFGFLTKPKR